MAVFVTGDLHGGLDIQKLRDWEADEKHVVLRQHSRPGHGQRFLVGLLAHRRLAADLLALLARRHHAVWRWGDGQALIRTEPSRKRPS